MRAGTLVPVEAYLGRTYNPDVEYVDGELRERNVGERPHSETQAVLSSILYGLRHRTPLRVFTEQRVQVKSSRFRILDVCVVLGRHIPPPIFVEPPFVCIEILSKDDTFTLTQERIDDFTAFGVPYIWVIDPLKREGWSYEGGHATRAADGILRTAEPAIEVDLNELFREIDG